MRLIGALRIDNEIFIIGYRASDGCILRYPYLIGKWYAVNLRLWEGGKVPDFTMWQMMSEEAFLKSWIPVPIAVAICICPQSKCTPFSEYSQIPFAKFAVFLDHGTKALAPVTRVCHTTDCL